MAKTLGRYQTTTRHGSGSRVPSATAAPTPMDLAVGKQPGPAEWGPQRSESEGEVLDLEFSDPASRSRAREVVGVDKALEEVSRLGVDQVLFGLLRGHCPAMPPPVVQLELDGAAVLEPHHRPDDQRTAETGSSLQLNRMDDGAVLHRAH